MAFAKGSIAFTSFNADNQDDLAFVALDAIPGGTVIYFSDNEWNGGAIGAGGAFNTGESYTSWTAPAAGAAAGSVIVINNFSNAAAAPIAANVGTAAPVAVTGSTNRGIAASGETIYAYLADAAAPSAPTAFLTAVTNSTYTAADRPLTNTSLTAGADALQLPNPGADIAAYTGSRTNQTSLAAYAAQINNPANWITQDAAGNQDADGIAPDLSFSTVGFSTAAVAETQSVGFAAGSLTLSQSEGNTGSTAFTFVVERAGGTSGDVAFSGQLASTAANSTDFAGAPALPLAFSGTIPAGAATATVVVNVAGDTTVEPDEAFTLVLTGASNNAAAAVATASLGAAATATGTIVNDDAAAIPSFTLSNYVRVGRFDLPEPTRTTPPANSLLAQEASAVTYDWDTDTLFVVGDGGTSVVQVTKTGQLINSMTLAPGGSPQGTDFYDPEGLAYVGNGRFVMTEERDRNAVLFTYAPGTTLTRAGAQTVHLGTFVDNIGLEGVTWDPATNGYIFVKEKSPESIFQTGIDFAAGTATNGSATTVASVDLFNPSLAGLLDFADVFALSNVAALNGSSASGHLLILSQESGKIVEVDRSGTIYGALTIKTDAGNSLSVVDQQHEGLTIDAAGNLYVVSENGGGDFNHPQLWVYAPSSAPNLAPTALALTNQTTAILENTNTVARIKVADVVITDDALGQNNLAVTGADAGSFEVDSTGLYIKAGTVLDFETKTSYSVTVTVDDPAVGAAPDASASYTLSVTDVAVETGGTPNLYISEAAPWSSGNSPVAADWFEVTNSGTGAIDITNWRMDDNSNSFALSVPLSGITNIAAGESVIFLETANLATASAAFVNTWFGGAAPAGLRFGSYSGSGVGLSTGGDAVNLYDAAGTLQANISFGASTTGTFRSFDNSAGLTNAAITEPSGAGKHGAFAAANDSKEIASPGTVGKLFISEVAPWSSGNSPVAADWFEVTNSSAFAVDITGWKMDDNSQSPAAAVALNGITSIAAGESVIFIETATPATTTAAFLNTWFGANPPPNLRIGTYSGSGVGLSTGGDAVNLYDATNTLRASVSFGASTIARSFDNAAGLNNAGISTLSTAGVNAAFAAIGDAVEIGSPGQITPVNQAPVAVDDSLATLVQGTGSRTIGFAALTGNDRAGPANEGGQTLTITAVGNATGGTATINGTNVIFTPTSGFKGQASFDYTVSDNGTSYGLDSFLTDVGTASFTIAPPAPDFTLQLLHLYGESGLLGAQTAPIMGALIDRFRAASANTLVLAEGDTWIPGPWLVGGADPSLSAVPGIGATALGRPDVAILNAFGVNASALGNHEFDLGSPVVSGAIAASGAWVGAQFPFITSNLDFSADASLRGLADATLGGTATNAYAGKEASTIKGKIAPYTVVTIGGQKIGIVGATTYDLLAETSPNGTVPKDDGNPSTSDLQEVAAYIQATVDALAAAGVNKIVMVDQLDTITRNQALAPLVHGIDIMVAGGGHERLGDANDTAVGFNGHSASFAGAYPIITAGSDGVPVLIVTTDTEYTYLGRLQAGFDANGVLDVAGLDNVINGAYASNAATLEAVYNNGQTAAQIVAGSATGTAVKAITDAVNAVVISKDGVKFGYSNVYLEGDRVFARAQETNLGDVTADANAYVARQALGATVPVFSLKNGGGIRASIGSIDGNGAKIANPVVAGTTGNISQLDVENALRFDNKLMVFDLTPQGLLNVLNFAAGLAAGNGGFAQVGGIRFSYDATLPAGAQVRNVALYDATGNFVRAIVQNGVVVPNAPAMIQAVALNFNAQGGDGYPIKANATNFRYLLANGGLSAPITDTTVDFTAAAGFANAGVTAAAVLGEQVAFENYLATFHGTPATAFNAADTPQSLDLRIENLAFRADAVIPVPVLINEFVYNHVGVDTNEYIEIKAAPNTDLSSYRLVLIEGDAASAARGAVISLLTPGTTNAAGYWVSAFLNNTLQNGAQTLLLVKDAVGLSSGQDLDTNNDGTLDLTPWGSIVDSIAVGTGTAGDLLYAGAPVLNPGFDGGSLTVGGASRLPDGADTNTSGDWVRNDFDNAGLPGFTGTPAAGEALNTPGTVNQYAVAPAAGFQISPAIVTVTEGGATASFTVRLATAPIASVTIPVTGNADATVSVASLTFTAANYNVPQTVTVTAVDDLLVEGTEATTIVLGAAVSADAAYNGLNPADVTATVIDNEPIALTAIHTIQGAAHLSPLVGQTVRTSGIVTAVDRTNSGSAQTIGFWIQDPNPDANDATSEGIFVFTGTTAGLPAVGDAVTVNGTVVERSPANAASNLTTTRLETVSFTVQSSGNALPAATVIGAGGRIAPKGAIYNDAAGSLNSGIGDFDPANEGIDFYESLEGMRVTLNSTVVVGATNGFDETWVLPDLGAGSTIRSLRGGILLGNGDDNPERVQLQFDGGVLPGTGPTATVADRLGTVSGILSYDFGNYEVVLTASPTVASGGLTQEKTSFAGDANRLTVAEWNVENLDPSDPKFDEIARLFVDNLKKPDVLALQEIQDNNGATNNGVIEATLTAAKLIAAIYARSGLLYSYADIPPADGTSGGEPGGNIRPGYLYNSARVTLVPGSLRTIADTALTAGDAFGSSRQPLVADFRFNNQNVTLIDVHSTSKGGSGSLFGADQPPVNGGEAQRTAQATEIKAVVDGLLTANPSAKVAVLGDLNEFAWNAPQQVLTGGATPNLFDLATLLPVADRYSYVFDGNTQALDHTLGSSAFRGAASYDIVHLDAEFPDAARVSDHDPSISRLLLPQLEVAQSPSFIGGTANATNTYLMTAGATVTGGAGADLMIARPGVGALAGGGGNDLFAFINGLGGGTVTIADFAGADHVTLQGFAANAAATALATQTTVAGNTTIILADNTHVVFAGVTALTAASFQ